MLAGKAKNLRLGALIDHKFCKSEYKMFRKIALTMGLIALTPSLAFAALDTGDTAWITTATALVLFMTLPGLALFYAGLVQPKNVVSVLMHHLSGQRC